MTDAYLDAVLGPLRDIVMGAYWANAWWLCVLMVPWMYVLWRADRTVKAVRVALIDEIEAHPDTYAKRSGSKLVAALQPVFDTAIEGKRWMPAAHGFWARRATPAGLARTCGFTPLGMSELRDAALGFAREKPLATLYARQRLEARR